ncbi:hypothetical protein LINPERHAP2_LOCUS24000, partial [Linum perenne]
MLKISNMSFSCKKSLVKLSKKTKSILIAEKMVEGKKDPCIIISDYSIRYAEMTMRMATERIYEGCG